MRPPPTFTTFLCSTVFSASVMGESSHALPYFLLIILPHSLEEHLLLLTPYIMSNSLQPYGLQPTRLLCPCGSPGKNTEVGCHFLLQGILLTQVSNLILLHYRQILCHRNHDMETLVQIEKPIGSAPIFSSLV